MTKQTEMKIREFIRDHEGNDESRCIMCGCLSAQRIRLSNGAWVCGYCVEDSKANATLRKRAAENEKQAANLKREAVKMRGLIGRLPSIEAFMKMQRKAERKAA